MRQELADTALAREAFMLDRLCAAVKAFYEDPNNVKAYEAWKKNKEAQYENHCHDGLDQRKPGQAEDSAP